MKGLSLLLGLALLATACGAGDDQETAFGNPAGTTTSKGKGGSAGSTTSGVGGGTSGGGGSLGQQTTTTKELCNDGLDNDGNGKIDEGCLCDLGKTQKCFVGDPGLAGNGLCTFGTQTCEKASGSTEFKTTAWGECLGSGKPGTEACDGKDNDCNGTVDDGCACKDGETQDCSTQCGNGKQECKGGQWGECDAPQPDANGNCPCVEGTTQECATQCGKGKQECKGGQWADCDAVQPDANGNCLVQVNLNVDGDCVCAPACPPEAPYPVGCKIDFQGGNKNGCVALVGNGQLYFQEGVKCDAGHLTGFVMCSSVPGAPLNAANCPINKDDPHWGQKPSDCPDIESGDPQSCYH